MDTVSENQNSCELKEQLKTTTNEFLLMIQRYEHLTAQLLKKLEAMTNRALAAEYQNKLVETLLFSGTVLTESEYHRLVTFTVRENKPNVSAN
jgi:hypothetical protein